MYDTCLHHWSLVPWRQGCLGRACFSIPTWRTECETQWALSTYPLNKRAACWRPPLVTHQCVKVPAFISPVKRWGAISERRSWGEFPRGCRAQHSSEDTLMRMILQVKRRHRISVQLSPRTWPHGIWKCPAMNAGEQLLSVESPSASLLPLPALTPGCTQSSRNSKTHKEHALPPAPNLPLDKPLHYAPLNSLLPKGRVSQKSSSLHREKLAMP